MLHEKFQQKRTLGSMQYILQMFPAAPDFLLSQGAAPWKVHHPGGSLKLTI